MELLGERDVDMKLQMASPPQPVFVNKISAKADGKNERIIPPRVELDSTSEESSSGEDVAAGKNINPLTSSSLSKLLKKRLDEAGAPLSHWQTKG